VHVRMLSHCPCLCSSMFRINPAHLLWVLDKLAEDEVVNQIVVPPEVAIHAVEAIKRMLDLTKPEYERVGFRGFTTFPERARTPGYVKTCPAKCEISHQN
jgi:hypothetical protein